MKNNVFLLDVPEKSENDAIGYNVYVDSVISSINSGAKMIGLLSNYGSGKSTIINMVEEKMRNDSSSNIEFVKVNLWKINELENDKSNVMHSLDSTIDIHKTLLKKLINKLPKESNKEYFNKKVDSNFTLFNIVTKRKSDIFNLYLILALFIFNLIAKIDLPGFSVPNFILFIVDLIVVIFFIVYLYDTKLYISFKKDSTERKIDENDTIDCFNEIVNEFFSTHSNLDKLIISIEDLDRYNDSAFIIKVLEQIYKFYNENSENYNENSKKKVIFIISLKPPFFLIDDSFDNDKKVENKENIDNEISEEFINDVMSCKELYEKIFDIIINLQTVSFQNYGVVLLGLINEKKKELQNLKINIPETEDDIGIWRYLYMGKKVSIRDIKHRFNYFLVLYSNLFHHKNSLLNPELININLETCLLVAYLEDEYSAEFYNLLSNSKRFDKIVSDYLLNKTFGLLDSDKSFDCEIIEALKKDLINLDYTMYFYKYPKNKPINNIFDSAIQNAIFNNNIKNIPNLEEYCNKASGDVIFKAIREKVNAKQFPSIIFDNKVLYEQTKQNFSNQIVDYLDNNCLFTSEKGIKEVQLMITKILNLEDEWLLEIYLEMLLQNLHTNYEDEDIVKYRSDLLKLFGCNFEYLWKFYDESMPLITIDELKNASSAEVSLALLPTGKINDKVYFLIDFIVKKFALNFQTIIEFLDRIKNVDKTIFKKIFSKFDFTKYSNSFRKSLYKKGYAAFDFKDIDDLEFFVSNVKVLTVDIERELIKYLKKLPKEDRKVPEKKYVNILNYVGSISSVANKYIPEFMFYYTHTFDIENELYKKGFYNQYCYSKFNRLKHMVYENDKFDNLKSSYLYYFKNANISDNYEFDDSILKYIKENLEFEYLNLDKIKILGRLPQTVDDLEKIFERKYKNPTEENAVDEYLSAIKKIDSSSEDAFVEKIISLVKSSRIILSRSTYNHVKRLLKTSNVRKIQHIKRLCSNS